MRILKSNLLLALTLPIVSSLSRAATPAESAAPGFVDRTDALGLKLGGDSACWVDIDGDGWVDLCASGVAWKNHHGTNFSRWADVGLVVASDFDNDGFTDLFSYSRMKLLRNEGGQKFTEVKLPKLPPTSSVGACWGDWNGDGFVDLFIGGFEDWDRGITYPAWC